MADSDTTTLPASDCVNAEYCREKFIRMDERRSHRFARSMSRIADLAHSLEASVQLFPRFAPSPGCLQPGIAVAAFARQLEHDINLMFQMIENEEEPEEDEEGGA